MRSRVGAAALSLLLVGAVAVPGAAAAPTPSTTTATTTPTTTATANPATPKLTPTTSTHRVPPPAPAPSDSGNSPAAPDPHPPAGGIGPHGEAVGGSRLLSRGRVLPAHAPALPPHLTARAWVLADLDTGDVLAARDPHGRYQPASIQKILTTVTLLPALPGNRTVRITRTAADTEGSHAGLVAGGRYTIDQLFRGLLLVSGNDAAEALAEAAGGRAATVAAMNATALRLGAYDTFIQTPSGLDGWQQLTSAYDMTVFLRAALKQPRFVTYDRTLETKLPAQPGDGNGTVRLYNQNVQFLDTVKGALVAKTGYTDAAQHTFAGVIERHGHHYGVVLLRAQRYPQDQWVQATQLVDWGLRLPKDTLPVGHLPAVVSAPATTPSPSTSAAISTSPSASATKTGTSSKSSTGLRLVLIVVLFGGVLLLGRRLRGPRGQNGREQNGGRRSGPGRPTRPRGPNGPAGGDQPPAADR